MVPELGHFALVIGLAFAICLSVVPVVGVLSSHKRLMTYAKPLSFGMFAALAF